MPKQQPCPSKHSLCATSSKNAKDKSNSSTLLAIRSTEDAVESGGRGSCCSSEKDSGYSDSSDWQQTDVEERWRYKSLSRGSEHTETSRPGQKQEVGLEMPGNPKLMPAGHELSAIYITNNKGPKQPDTVKKRGQMPQRKGSREAVSSGAAHMILLPQPSLLLATFQLPKPSSRKPSSTEKMMNNTYLPILNSYPRIAPHPSKKPPDKSPSRDESQNLSKRVCTEHKRDEAPVASSLPEQHLNKQPKLAFTASGLPCSSTTTDSLSSCSATTVPSSQGSLSGSSLYRTASTYLSTRGTPSTRNCRFLNTVEILRQSGLLDITLRTKELLRQSNTTEHDIAQLRQHTELLCQAASNPNGVAAWERLHRSMAESGSYSDVKILQNEQIQSHLHSARPTESISGGDASSPVASPCLTTITGQNQHSPVPQQSHSGQGRAIGARYKSAEKVTLKSPNSSTG